jgi:hypothetical protein
VAIAVHVVNTPMSNAREAYEKAWQRIDEQGIHDPEGGQSHTAWMVGDVMHVVDVALLEWPSIESVHRQRERGARYADFEDPTFRPLPFRTCWTLRVTPIRAAKWGSFSSEWWTWFRQVGSAFGLSPFARSAAEADVGQITMAGRAMSTDVRLRSHSSDG